MPPAPPRIDILRAIGDDQLLGQHFKNEKDWKAWKAFLAALFGLKLTPEQLRIFQSCTNRNIPPPNGTNEAWLVVGRRGGKSFILATIATYLACFHDWKQYAGPGERITIMIICADLKQCRVVLRYCEGLLRSAPMLNALIANKTRERIDLSNRVTIESHAASFKSTRGYSIAAALVDELAFFPTDELAAEPDKEVIAALRPGMSNIPNSMLLSASSPYARRGELFNAYQRHFGKDDSSVLVWQAPTRVMHPRIPQRIIDEAMEADQASAAAEYLATFRTDMESFVSREAVQACIAPNVIERMPSPEINYVGCVDPSGGSVDEMTLAIAHHQHSTDTTVIDALRWFKPPFSPEVVVQDFARVLKSYNVGTISGDRYAGEWPREQFARFGITYEPSSKSKSELYQDLLPLINSCRISLLDQPKAINQLCSLERRTARGGKDSIDHPSGSHDDRANVIAGAATLALTNSANVNLNWVSGPSTVNAEEEARRFRVAQLMSHISSYAR